MWGNRSRKQIERREELCLTLEPCDALGIRGELLLHGEDAPPPPGDPARSEAQEARDRFAGLSSDEQTTVITFLKSLVNFSPER